MPWRSSSAATSIRPEPQRPTGGTLPITLIRRRPSTTTFSIAPVLPRMPQEIRAPSKAGPAAVEAAESLPSASKHDLAVGADVDQQRGPLGVGQAGGQDAGHGVAADESADHRHHVAAAAGMDVQAQARRPETPAPRPAAGTKGTSPSGLGSTPQSNCCIVVLPAKVTS